MVEVQAGRKRMNRLLFCKMLSILEFPAVVAEAAVQAEWMPCLEIVEIQVVIQQEAEVEAVTLLLQAVRAGCMAVQAAGGKQLPMIKP